MHSDACKNPKCQAPLQLKCRKTGQVNELLHWSWPAAHDEQTATFISGDTATANDVLEGYELLACRCGEQHPATDWPRALKHKPLPFVTPGERHPEQMADEVFVTNLDPAELSAMSWTTKRLGNWAYNPDGTVGSQALRPVFIKRYEAMKAGYDVKNALFEESPAHA